MYGYGFYYDRTYILLIIGMLLSVAASAKLKSTFAKYRGVRSASGLTGEQAARRILQAAGITDVQVRAVSGSLTDHYDPRTKTVNLSQDIFGQSSLAAVGVADTLFSMPFIMRLWRSEAPLFLLQTLEVHCLGRCFSWGLL